MGLKSGLFKLRCKIPFVEGKIELKNGLSVSIAGSNREKFKVVREACARKYRRIERLLTDAGFVAHMDMKLYKNLKSLIRENFDKTSIAMFDIPATPLYVIFRDSKLEDLAEKLKEMRLAEALGLCEVILFTDAVISNADTSLPLVIKAIRDKFCLPITS